MCSIIAKNFGIAGIELAFSVIFPGWLPPGSNQVYPHLNHAGSVRFSRKDDSRDRCFTNHQLCLTHRIPVCGNQMCQRYRKTPWSPAAPLSHAKKRALGAKPRSMTRHSVISGEVGHYLSGADGRWTMLAVRKRTFWQCGDEFLMRKLLWALAFRILVSVPPPTPPPVQGHASMGAKQLP